MFFLQITDIGSYICENLSDMAQNFLPTLLISAMILSMSTALTGSAKELDYRLEENTLRLDYNFSGTDKICEISLDELIKLKGWAGRRWNMKEVPLRGNGQICMKEASSGDTLYRMAFSTLFQEWQATEEATHTRRSFENVFLVPMPAVKVDITVELFDFWNNISAEFTHTVDPEDILIRQISGISGKYIHQGGSPEDCIDIVIVGEGYTSKEMDSFFADATIVSEAIFKHKPFDLMKDRFNIIALPAISGDSGVSVPGKGIWKNTALSSHFNTFYTDRYLTTLKMKKLHDTLAGVPYEHIIIIANTETYGGGGIFNSYSIAAAHDKNFAPVIVHEFGHSFAGLADEYFYDDQYIEYYYPEVEPWEQNITTKADFASKWEKLVDNGAAGLFEGGGYQSKGVWRGADNCRMRTNAHPDFCVVCREAIERIIRFYTED